MSQLFQEIPAETRLVYPLGGGLGNQLFQVVYAQACFGEAIGAGRLVFDDSWFETQAINAHERIHPRLQAALPAPLERLPAPARTWKHKLGLASRGKKLKINGTLPSGHACELSARLSPEPNTCRVETLCADGDVILESSPQAFLRKLKTETELSPAYARLREQLNADGPFASLHVRRGDYLKVASFIPTLAYYERALALLDELVPGIHIWIHSDDIAWCRQQPLFQRPACRFVDMGQQADALHEMLVLSDASYVVMANSTYSWWISAFARVTQPAYRRAIMPGRWFAGADEAITRFFMRADILSLKPWD